MTKISLLIDGKIAQVAEGTTILDAARAIDIDVPTLCFARNLTPANVCRLCVVEVDGTRALVPSCSRIAEPNMVVRTNTDRVRLARKTVIELLASASDLSLSGELLQRAHEYGADLARFGGRDDANPSRSPTRAVKDDNDLYVRDYDKCVLCYKCVEACGTDAQHTFAIAIAGRGYSATVSAEFDVPLPESACVFCGNCIPVCPTGALMFKAESNARARGEFDERAQTTTTTICPYCGVGCPLTLTVQDNRILRVGSPEDSPVSHGHLCIKGRFGWGFVER